MKITLSDFGDVVSGKVVVKMPTNGERIKLFKEAGMDFFKLSETLSSSKSKDQEKMMTDLLVNCMDDLGGFCEKVDLLFDEEKITSFDQIKETPNLMGVQIKIATAVMLGGQNALNKKKKK